MAAHYRIGISQKEIDMNANTLGKQYRDGDIIVQQGDEGEHIFIIQQGTVEVVRTFDGIEYQIALLGEGEFFGEMAIFERSTRAATVRALGDARVLTLERADFLRRLKEDPSLAFHLVEVMSARIRELGQQVTEFKSLLFENGIPADIGTTRQNNQPESG